MDMQSVILFRFFFAYERFNSQSFCVQNDSQTDCVPSSNDVENLDKLFEKLILVSVLQ